MYWRHNCKRGIAGDMLASGANGFFLAATMLKFTSVGPLGPYLGGPIHLHGPLYLHGDLWLPCDPFTPKAFQFTTLSPPCLPRSGDSGVVCAGSTRHCCVSVGV